jgi:putative transposase
MPRASDFRAGRHVVHKLNAHLVFVPKYRRGVITPRVFDILKAAWEKVCADFEGDLLESNFEPDHVHLMVAYRSADLPEVRNKLWGEHFWSPSYCAVSCGGAPLEIVAKYIQSQNRTGSSPS